MISLFELFTVGVGPSSSHTVGPMRAAEQFVDGLQSSGKLSQSHGLTIELFGSLAATGHGHGTVPAIMAGLEGKRPESVDPDAIGEVLVRVQQHGRLRLGGQHDVKFSENDIVLRPLTQLPRHTNAMRFAALDADGTTVQRETYYSIGGGFIVTDADAGGSDAEPEKPTHPAPHPFSTADELLALCDSLHLSISELVMRNECASRDEDEVRIYAAHIDKVMTQCAQRGSAQDGRLPGALRVRRRAKRWLDQLEAASAAGEAPPTAEWVGLIALAVNEENASGGRVVTAPTNGAAGIVPAVLHYAKHFVPRWSAAGRAEVDDAVTRYFLTATAVGSLFALNASISGAEVGCQGEVGSASAMAAAGLAELLGGTVRQVQNAAEIAMEHSLGLTCDPIGGLVQIPCIERNAIAANKAVNAAHLAVRGDGDHHVSLDQVIETMRQTGADMSDKYKETATGGLAVNVPLC